VTFAAFYLDKRAARLGAWRTPEKTLLFLALVGGGVGAKLGQSRLRHKTRKQPFGHLLNLCCVLSLGVLAVVVFRPI